MIAVKRLRQLYRAVSSRAKASTNSEVVDSSVPDSLTAQISPPVVRKAAIEIFEPPGLTPTQRKLLDLTANYSAAPTEEKAIDIVHELVRSSDILQAARWIVRVANLSKFDPDLLIKLHASLPVSFVVLGGGEDFVYPLWQNLDARASIFNTYPIVFDANHVLPLETHGWNLVYIHSALDACEQPTVVQRICDEAARVVNRQGAVVITSSTLNHQQLAESVSQSGLTILSNDRERIISRFDYVPRIAQNSQNRTYIVAIPEGAQK